VYFGGHRVHALLKELRMKPKYLAVVHSGYPGKGGLLFFLGELEAFGFVDFATDVGLVFF
jgi:hypothetical protein